MFQGRLVAGTGIGLLVSVDLALLVWRLACFIIATVVFCIAVVNDPVTENIFVVGIDVFIALITAIDAILCITFILLLVYFSSVSSLSGSPQTGHCHSSSSW